MPLLFDTAKLREEVRYLVDKGKKNQYIENKLLEDGVSLNQINELMRFVDQYRNQSEIAKLQKEEGDKRSNKGLLIFWTVVIAIVALIALITNNDNFFLEGAILAVAIHQIIGIGFKSLW